MKPDPWGYDIDKESRGEKTMIQIRKIGNGWIASASGLIASLGYEFYFADQESLIEWIKKELK